MSESDRSNLGGIADRWNTILKEWDLRATSMPYINWDNIKKVFHARLDTQSTPEGYVAWCLDPRTQSTTIPYDIDKVADFIQQHCGLHAPEQRRDIQVQLMQFRRGEAIFQVPIDAGEWIYKPYNYWMAVGAKNPGCILVKPALRLFSCLANSVPSERSFSHQNYIHNKVRNRLSQEKADMLTFVYYNSRALDSSLAMPSDCNSGCDSD
jgi:hypothetical protein